MIYIYESNLRQIQCHTFCDSNIQAHSLNRKNAATFTEQTQSIIIIDDENGAELAANQLLVFHMCLNFNSKYAKNRTHFFMKNSLFITLSII